MNQQRSRRFRSAQEAKVKEEVRQEAILEWEGPLLLEYVCAYTCLHSLSPGSSRSTDGGCCQERESLGPERHHSWHSVHGPASCFTSVLGGQEDEQLARMAECALHYSFICCSRINTGFRVDTSHHFRRFCSRRRRAQDHGLYSSTAQPAVSRA